jgi:hypothetical protein
VCSRRWRSIQSGLPESAHESPELVKHASLVEVDGMSRNTIQGQQAACNSRTDTMGALDLQVVPSPKGVCVKIRACATDPLQVFPTRRCLRRRRGIGLLPTTTSGPASAKTSPPEGVFRSLRHKCFYCEYRRAVGTHNGQTRKHQAGYRPRHRTDCSAGTTILYHLRIHRRTHPPQVATTPLDGAAGAWATPQGP